MKEFWEDTYRNEKTNWGFEPSDSALRARNLFSTHHLKDILIPGIGYGRNAKLFCEQGMRVTGIEISGSAIEMARTENNLDIPIYQGSVNEMPFDDKLYDGIFCYALLHLLNRNERKNFIRNCYRQLKPGGYMVFTVISTRVNYFESGRRLSTHRYQIRPGLKVYFYDLPSAGEEFESYGVVNLQEIEEPIKHLENEPLLPCIYISCKRN